MRRGFWAVTIAAFGLTVGLGVKSDATTSAPQSDRAKNGPAARTGEVRIDAIVTDRQGRPVPGLTPADFELRDEGVLQTIDAVEFGGVAQVSDVEAPRLFALFLDEYHVGAGASTVRARDALVRFVDELRQDDRVVIMKPLDPFTSIRLARDRDAVREALKGFAGRKGDYAPRTPFEENYISRAPAAVDAARAQIVTSALQALTARLGELRVGRKAIVLVSEGFVRDASRDGERLTDVQAVIRTADQFDVAIYAFDPRAGGATRPVGEQNGGPPASDERDRAMATLRTLAEQTNGEVIVNADDPLPRLRRITRDLDACYMLTYQRLLPDDGKFHAIELRAKRRDVQVRTRAGYWAPVLNDARRSRAAPVMAPAGITRVRARPLHESTLIRPWFGMARGPDGRTRITFTWEPGGQPAGRRRADPQGVVLSAVAADGTVLFRGRVGPVQAGAGVEARAAFDAHPGHVDLEMTIQAADESVLDSDIRVVAVPNLSDGRTVIATPEVLRTSTAREFRAASDDPEALPVVSREFRRAERLLIRVPAYGPAGVAIKVSAKLLNLVGQSMRELSTVPAATPDGVTQFDLPLSALAPSTYSVELTATSEGGTAKHTIVFRVIG